MLPNLKQTATTPPPTPDDTDPNPNDKPNYAILYGSLTAIICVAYVYTLYLSDPLLLVSGYESFTWAFFFISMILVGVRTRNAQDGAFIEFRYLLKPIYQAFFLAYMLKYIFIYTLFRFIDPTLLDLVKDIGRKMLISNRDPNWTDEMLQQQITVYNQQEIYMFDFIGLSIHLVMGFVLALIVSFVLKRERPDY
jgi:hypothetical protein